VWMACSCDDNSSVGSPAEEWDAFQEVVMCKFMVSTWTVIFLAGSPAMAQEQEAARAALAYWSQIESDDKNT